MSKFPNPQGNHIKGIVCHSVNNNEIKLEKLSQEQFDWIMDAVVRADDLLLCSPPERRKGKRRARNIVWGRRTANHDRRKI